MTGTASRRLNRARVCGCPSNAPRYRHPSSGAIRPSGVAPNEFVAAAGKLVQRRLEHVPQKWEPVLRKRTWSNKEVERDDDSKNRHPALPGMRASGMDARFTLISA